MESLVGHLLVATRVCVTPTSNERSSCSSPTRRRGAQCCAQSRDRGASGWVLGGWGGVARASVVFGAAGATGGCHLPGPGPIWYG
jgi:hypothetical protein